MNLFELEWRRAIVTRRGHADDVARSQDIHCPNGLVVSVWRGVSGKDTYDIYTVDNPCGVKPIHVVGAEPIAAQAILYHLLEVTPSGNT